MSWFEDIIKFHIHGQCYIGGRPEIPSEETVELRRKLIREEVINELLKAMDEDNLEKIADGIIDSIVVLIGTGISYGLDLPLLWEEIHKSNMFKVLDGPIKNEDGKVQKPEGWQPPNLKKVLNFQGSIQDGYVHTLEKEPAWDRCVAKDCTNRSVEISIPTKMDLCIDHMEWGDLTGQGT